MSEKQLKELNAKLDVNSNEANIVRQLLAQYTAIKQTKLSIASIAQSYKLGELYNQLITNSEFK